MSAAHHDDAKHYVPFGVRVTAAFAWRFLVIAAALGVIVWVVGVLAILSTTLAIALLLAALMAPGVNFLVQRARLRRGVATAVTVVGGLLLLGGLITFVIAQFADGLPAMQRELGRSLDTVKLWLTEGPLALQTADINKFIDQLFDLIKENQAAITTSALTTAGAVGQFLTGFVLVLFILIFFLLHGRDIWRFLLLAIPVEARDQVDVAGQRGFVSLTGYVRATTIVAFVDAVGIGVGLWIVGTPLVVPLATLVFLGAFVPVIGAIITGAIAVLVTLVSVGWVKALIVLGVVVGVQQVESNILHPLLLGKAVELHPLAVILAITAGLIVAGITGALLSVPLVAVINAGAKSLAGSEEATRIPVEPRAGTPPPKVPDETETSEPAATEPSAE